jgi:Metallo-peptidase family M12/Reprolysin family propeptide
MQHKNVLVTFFIAILVGITFGTKAQKQTIALLKNNTAIATNLLKYVRQGEIAIFDKDAAAKLLQAHPDNINIYFQFEDKGWEIELEKSNILSPSFFVTTGSDPNEKFSYNNEALHYKGKIKGKRNSFAAISILANKMVAVIADEKGNINIGAINTAEATINNQHIIYRESDLLIQNEFVCNTNETPDENNNPIPVYNNAAASTTATINAEPIDIYFEADYQTFLNNGSNATNVVNYVTALFNVVNVLYENDSVNTKISAIKVWNIADPYVGSNASGTVLSLFSGSMSNGFPGDVAHFLSQRGLGGGVAYLNVLCGGNSSKTAVSGNLSNSFNTFPTYSWSVMVIAHELGHNFGSPHTQSCSWPGGAIDNCYTTEGGCAQGPAPTTGGTIMSYCHLTGYGINIANGFGPLPGAKIRSFVRNNTCINPGVYFETTFHNVNEELADVTNGCLNYKLITTKLKIPYAPTQPVDVTLVPVGNTGLEIGTNNDIEISPSNFTLDAANLSQTINFKVYNDAIVENLETLSLNFNINANGGNAVKRNIYTTDIINITSEDHRPDSTINQILFYENFDAITSGLGNWTQNIIYGATSPNRWIVANNAGTDFPTKAAYISNNNSTATYAGTTLADSTIVGLESPTINAAGFSNMHLTCLFKCNGDVNFVNGGPGGGTTGGNAYLDFGRVYYSINNGSTWIILRDNIARYTEKFFADIILPADADNATQLKIGFVWLNNSNTVNNPAFIIDSIVIKGVSTCAIQTATHASNSDDEYLGPSQTIHYYNPITKNIMATIENNSAFDFGCTKVELLRTGAGASQAWGVLASDKVSSKAFKITTTNTNTSAPYTIKLYYTDAEINGWLTTTGNATTDIKIVKTNGDVTVVAPASPAIFSSINDKTNFGATAHAVVTATFAGVASTSTYALMKPYGVPDCSNSMINYATDIIGSTYQWQVNNGIGYIDIMNNAVYNNVTTPTLNITNPAASSLGNKYRCLVSTIFGITYSREFILKFGNTWLGMVSKAWENPLNWSCNTVPDDKTDVIINGGTTFTAELSTVTTIRSLQMINVSDLSIKNGANLIINH